jgi:hypothetical protein
LDWKKESKKYGPAGFWVHLHLLCKTWKKKAPRADELRDRFRLINGVGAHVEDGDVFHLDRASFPRRYARYMPAIGNLLPGYREDQCGRLRLESMPAEDVLHFLDATKGMRKLVSHNLDRARSEAALIDPKGFLRLPKGMKRWKR